MDGGYTEVLWWSFCSLYTHQIITFYTFIYHNRSVTSLWNWKNRIRVLTTSFRVYLLVDDEGLLFQMKPSHPATTACSCGSVFALRADARSWRVWSSGTFRVTGTKIQTITSSINLDTPCKHWLADNIACVYFFADVLLTQGGLCQTRSFTETEHSPSFGHLSPLATCWGRAEFLHLLWWPFVPDDLSL